MIVAVLTVVNMLSQAVYRNDPQVTCLIIKLAADIVAAHVSFLKVRRHTPISCLSRQQNAAFRV